MPREVSSIARARRLHRLIRELPLADGPCLSLFVSAASLRPPMCPKKRQFPRSLGGVRSPSPAAPAQAAQAAAPRAVSFAAAAENLAAARRSLARTQRRAASRLHHGALVGLSGAVTGSSAARAEIPHAMLDGGVDADGGFSKFAKSMKLLRYESSSGVSSSPSFQSGRRRFSSDNVAT